jgi:hypothetical protein
MKGAAAHLVGRTRYLLPEAIGATVYRLLAEQASTPAEASP